MPSAVEGRSGCRRELRMAQETHPAQRLTYNLNVVIVSRDIDRDHQAPEGGGMGARANEGRSPPLQAPDQARDRHCPSSEEGLPDRYPQEHRETVRSEA